MNILYLNMTAEFSLFLQGEFLGAELLALRFLQHVLYLPSWGAWLAQSIEPATLDLGVTGSSPTLGVENT